jgi:hypothetical protein
MKDCNTIIKQQHLTIYYSINATDKYVQYTHTYIQEQVVWNFLPTKDNCKTFY